jgi:hypothetical protein
VTGAAAAAGAARGAARFAGLRSALRRYDVVLLLVFGGCGDNGDPRLGGSFTLSRGDQRLLREQARADWCATDSTLSLVAVAPHWGVGVAARVPWPLRAADSVLVGAELGGANSAAIAVRPVVGDSVGWALVARRGWLEVRGGRTADGRFRVEAAGADSSPVRLDGEFHAVPVGAMCPG